MTETKTHRRTGTKAWRIQSSAITKWTRELDLDEDQRSLIFYLHDHAASENLTTEEVGKLLKQSNGAAYSGDSIYQAMTGRRQKSQMANFFKAVDEFRVLNDQRKTIVSAPFIETNLTKKIFKICDTARIMRTVQYIIGESHIGKTTALEEYQRQNNHGRTIYIRAPHGGAYTKLIERFCHQLHLPVKGNVGFKSERVMECFDDQMVLIVDEAHQFFREKRSLLSLEFLRELHDVSKCGMVISATPVWDEAKEDAEIGKVLRQLDNRHLITSRLPSKPTRANLRDFAKAFGLPEAKDEAADLQKEVIDNTSLGRWTSILEGGSRIASKKKEKFNWEHVLTCHATLQKLAGN